MQKSTEDNSHRGSGTVPDGLRSGMLVIFIPISFYGTKIDGVVYGCMTPEEVAVDVTARQQNYSLAIRGRYEMEEVRTGKELGASIDPLEELRSNLRRQRPWMWPVSFLRLLRMN